MTVDSRTQVRRHAQHRDRWSSFDGRQGILEMVELSADNLRKFEVFAEYDTAFLEKLTPDISLCRWSAGSVLFEEGSYIDLAFYVVDGSVEVGVDKQRGAPQAAEQPIFDPVRTGLMSAEQMRQLRAQGTGAEGVGPQPGSIARPFDLASPSIAGLSHTLLAKDLAAAGGITFLASMDFDLRAGSTMQLGPGEIFGEIGAMSGWPQSVTARTASTCTLIQIRVPALRTLRRRSPAFKERLDMIYRRLSLSDQLRTTPLFRGCDPRFIETLTQEVELVSCEPDEVIAIEGENAEALYLVRSGFVKLSQKYSDGSIVVNYLSKGMTLGEVELLVGHTGGWTVTAHSVEYAELVKIAKPQFVEALSRFPEVEKRLWDSAVARIREAGFSRRNIGHAAFIQTALDNGLVQGNSMLVIDLNVCTRCDDCVRACAATHEGRPRFIREGEKIGNLEITDACYHCRDPVCLVGCPTGAIHRAGVGAVVAIDDNLCIGCQTCARSCPYDAITMHPTGEVWPDDMIPESLRGRDRLVATKCDLCHTDPKGPACVRNCPNGCAYRIGSLEEFEQLLGKR
jgi:CRP-like cAMP-binding protein/Fe-S-cluster-containing dehydrogenase component